MHIIINISDIRISDTFATKINAKSVSDSTVKRQKPSKNRHRSRSATNPAIENRDKSKIKDFQIKEIMNLKNKKYVVQSGIADTKSFRNTGKRDGCYCPEISLKKSKTNESMRKINSNVI